MKVRLFESRADRLHPIYMRIRVDVADKDRDECIGYLRNVIDEIENQTEAIGASFGEFGHDDVDKTSFIVQIAFGSTETLEKFQDGYLNELLKCNYFDNIRKGIQHPFSEDNKEFWDLYPIVGSSAYILKSYGVMGRINRDYPYCTFYGLIDRNL